MATFTQYVKTASSPTVYGKTSDGKWVAFETGDQFTGSGGQWGQIQTVSTAPTGAVNYSSYSPTQTTQSSQTTSTPQPTTTSTTKATTSDPPAGSGINSTLWNSLSPADQAFVTAMNTNAQSTYQQGQANYSINAQTMQQALQLAQTDPTIKSIYGDSAKMGLQDLHNNLGLINSEYASQFGLQTAEQAQARRDLADKEAAAGRAQSGFRQQAQTLQQQQQTGVIQSSQRQLQQQVNQLGSQYESQFGSTALGQTGGVTAGGATYTPVGGITGSQVNSQTQAVEQKQGQIYNTISNPLTA